MNIDFPSQLRQTGLSQSELAEFLNTSRTTIANYYSGDNKPFPDQVGLVTQLLEDMALWKAHIKAHELPLIPTPCFDKIIVDLQNE